MYIDDASSISTAQASVSAGIEPGQVLVVTPVGLEGKGGIDRLNLYIHGYLSSRGWAGRLSFIGTRGAWPGPFWFLTFVVALVRFAIACARGRHDLAHIHVSTNGSALRKVWFGGIARLFGLPYVIQYHGAMSAEVEAARPLWHRALGILARGAQRCIVLGEGYVAPFERLGVARNQIRVVHNGVPDVGDGAVIPRRENGAFRILFSGEVGERKGAHLLIGALSRLGTATQWQCTIAGNGDVASYREIARKAGIEERTNFTGWLDIKSVHKLMREADIVVLPSRAEALPLALIEGASAGAALIACDTGAVRDIVRHGVNGLIVTRDEEAIAAALRELMANTDQRHAMQAASRQIYCDNFQASHYAAAILQTYEDCKRRA